MTVFVDERVGELRDVRPYSIGAAPPESLEVEVKECDVAVEQRKDLVRAPQIGSLLIELDPVSTTFTAIGNKPAASNRYIHTYIHH